MNEMKVFNNEEFGSVRTIVVNETPWFVGKDVAEILGYSNPRKALADHVDIEDKNDGVTIRDSIGREQKPVCINESGLFSLVLSSKLPSAKKFKRWVTSEVLPVIRKHGVYAVEEVLNDPDVMIAALTALKEERAKVKALQESNAIQAQQIAEMKPKASYYDIILQSKSTIPISAIAKDYGMSAKRLNDILHDLKIQYKQGSLWLLYQKYAEQGYTQTRTYSVSETTTSVHTYWTQKGRLFLYDALKAEGVLPLIERESAA